MMPFEMLIKSKAGSLPDFLGRKKRMEKALFHIDGENGRRFGGNRYRDPFRSSSIYLPAMHLHPRFLGRKRRFFTVH